MAALFDNFKESLELFNINRSIFISVDLVEKFVGRNFAELAFPMCEGLILRNLVRLIRVECTKSFIDLFDSCFGKLSVCLSEKNSRLVKIVFTYLRAGTTHFFKSSNLFNR